MKINEIAMQLNTSKRALKYYEEQNLLNVQKDTNGYRMYSKENIETLKKIILYRKLGISIKEIKTLLKQEDISMLQQIYETKKQELQIEAKELEALQQYLTNRNVEQAMEYIDYDTIAQAMQDSFRGFYGFYTMHHFLPYLQIPITTNEQKEALQTIINFWDNVEIHIPLTLRFTSYLMYRFTPKPTLETMVKKLDQQMKKYTSITEEKYSSLRQQVLMGAKMKNSFIFKYNPIYMVQRKYQKRLQDVGYNDIFIKNMCILSPLYKEYHDALTSLNDRICKELGLHYDSNYQLVFHK